MITQITNETKYREALQAIEEFLQKGFDKLSKTETLELQRISMLVEKYEAIHYPLPFKPQSIEDMIKIKMIEKKNETKRNRHTIRNFHYKAFGSITWQTKCKY